MDTPAPFRTRLSRLLLGPSDKIVDRAERRRARLLAMLQLTQCVQLIPCSFVLAHTESNPAVSIMAGAAGLLFLGTYLLNRAGHVRAALWLYLFINVLLTPIISFSSHPSPDFSPFSTLVYLLPPILIANTVSTAGVTLGAGLLGLVLSVVPMLAFGPEVWHRGIVQGVMFVLVHLGLVLAFGVHRSRVEADRSAELRARNDELESLRCNLETQVEARTAELQARNAEMRLVLDHVTEGVFTIDLAGRFVSAPSSTLLAWFGNVSASEPFYRYFGRHAPRFGLQAELAWRQVIDDELPFDVTLGQIPDSFSVDERRYQISLTAIGADDADVRFLVVVADVTTAVERAIMVREKRETSALFEHMISDRRGFVEFLDDASSHVTRVLACQGNVPDYARDLHTLKGNTLSFGIESVGQLCHDLETQLADTEAFPAPEDLVPLRERWERLTRDVERLLGHRRRFLEMSPEQHGMLERAVERGAPTEHVLHLVRALRLEPVRNRLHHLAEQSRRLADRLGKRVCIEVEDDGSRADGKGWPGLWSALVHVTRNAIDHGVESPHERIALHKSDVGKVWLRASTNEAGVLCVEVEDDGRGVDRDAVAAQLEARGLTTGEDLVSSLCVDGLSTATSVDDVSGRGLGMGALRAAVVALGGTLQVESTQGRGTKVRVLVPTVVPTSLAA